MMGVAANLMASLSLWIATYPGNYLLLTIAVLSICMAIYIFAHGIARRRREAQMAGVYITPLRSRLRRRR
jgi:hypothetical protein